ncbi:hypothetical protein QCA50_015474 [Cerrena zonata]|uniref:Uncharacterized protein n=1 Tax=Cerrena zonata TaxID=2478898 RepID=A0AAW0FMH7_9APHY
MSDIVSYPPVFPDISNCGHLYATYLPSPTPPAALPYINMHPSINTYEQTNSWVLTQAFRPEDGHRQLYLSRPVSPSSDTVSTTSLDVKSIFEPDVNKSMFSVDSSNPYDDISYDSDGDSESADDGGYVNTCDRCSTCLARHMCALQCSIAASGFVIQSLAPVIDNITTNTTITTNHSGNVPRKGPLANAGERYTEGGDTYHPAADGQRLYTAKPPSVDEGPLPGVLSQDKNKTM